MMNVYEVAEALEGVGLTLEDLAEGRREPRLWALVAAVRECVESLDAIAEQMEEAGAVLRP